MPKQKSTHVDDPAAVGRRLREARERAGLSQRELAFPGCSAAYISRIEAGARIPSLQLLRELGRRIGVSEDYLATGAELAPAERKGRALVEAEVALRLDDLDEAERLYSEALESAAGPIERARALVGLGQLAFRHEDSRRAIALLEEALELHPAGGLELAGGADTLGRAYADAGELDAAIAVFERFLAEAVRHDDLGERVRFSVLLANALVDAGSFARAEELLGHTLALTHDWVDPLVRARLLWSQSRLHTMQGNYASAARYARKALEILELTEHTVSIARAHHLLAYVELDRGETDEALELLRRGRAVLASGGDRRDEARFALEEARALAQLGRVEDAAALAMETAGLLADAEPLEAGRGYSVLADVWRELGDRGRAIELYELAAELLAAKPNRVLVHVYSALAELLEQEGRKDDALELLKRAMHVQTEVGRPLT